MKAALFTSTTEEWATPQDFFDTLDAEFHFTLDPCSTDENAKCVKYYTKAQDGLAQDWTGETVFCNPPYGREMPKWIRKCYEHMMSGGGYCGDADTSPDGYQGISRVHIRQGRNPFHQRPTEIRRIKERCAVPVNGGSVQRGGRPCA